MGEPKATRKGIYCSSIWIVESVALFNATASAGDRGPGKPEIHQNVAQETCNHEYNGTTSGGWCPQCKNVASELWTLNDKNNPTSLLDFFVPFHAQSDRLLCGRSSRFINLGWTKKETNSTVVVQRRGGCIWLACRHRHFKVPFCADKSFKASALGKLYYPASQSKAATTIIIRGRTPIPLMHITI